MAIYPHAVPRLWQMYDPERPIVPRMVILHTNATNSEDPPSTGGLSWHFQVGQTGVVYQHRDTQTEAAANADANQFAISIETWDGGAPETTPWNDAQLDAIVALISWCCDTHAIPRQIIAVWNGSGIGYHRMFPQWDQPYHSCPGDLRAGQFSSIIIPRLTRPTTEVDMTPGQCRDKQGRKWHFYLDDQAGCSSLLDGKANNRPLGTVDPGWSSGFDAYCDTDGTIAVCGRLKTGELAQIVFVPGGAAPILNRLAVHVYPPA